jgi:hypothetical protein
MGACKLLELLANSARSAALRALRLILLPGPRLLLDIPELMLKPSDEAEKEPTASTGGGKCATQTYGANAARAYPESAMFRKLR